MTARGMTEDQLERYSRHILLAEVGVAGQVRLLESSALVVGAGGLGSAALVYLAAAGVGHLGLVDGDVVELSNLNRQIAHDRADVGRRKVDSAREAVRAINPDCRVTAIGRRLVGAEARRLVRRFDVVLDGSDNFPTRFVVADACWLEKVPLVSAAIRGFEGQLLSVIPAAENPCYRCLLPEPPPEGFVPTCAEAGVLGPAVGVLGTLQAVEAVKVLLGIGQGMTHRLLAYNALDGTFRTIRRTRDPACRLCGPRATISDVVEHRVRCCEGSVCGPDGVCVPEAPRPRPTRGKAPRRRTRKGYSDGKNTRR